jgi:hypothetical protein
MVFADAHVHIHRMFDLTAFLDAACGNFRKAAVRVCKNNEYKPILLLTEAPGDYEFDNLASSTRAGRDTKRGAHGSWVFQQTAEECTLLAMSREFGNIWIIAGQQISTAEGLEVLALGTRARFNHGESAGRLVDAIKLADALPVIPWGFGKWMGRRGAFLKEFLLQRKAADFFLGDNGGRTFFIGEPMQFQTAREAGFKILPGSDPLPFSFEETRAGSFGFFSSDSISPSHLARDLKRSLRNGQNRIYPYGKLESPWRFLMKQVAMQVKKLSHPRTANP